MMGMMITATKQELALIPTTTIMMTVDCRVTHKTDPDHDVEYDDEGLDVEDEEVDKDDENYDNDDDDDKIL